jgi:hypothetical protein
MAARKYWHCPAKMTVSMKSIARIAYAGERGKPAHLTVLRCGAESTPSASGVSHTVEGATLIPSRASSP